MGYPFWMSGCLQTGAVSKASAVSEELRCPSDGANLVEQAGWGHGSYGSKGLTVFVWGYPFLVASKRNQQANHHFGGSPKEGHPFGGSQDGIRPTCVLVG